MHCLLVKHLGSTSCFPGQGPVPNNYGNTELHELQKSHESQPLPVKNLQSHRVHSTKTNIENKWQKVLYVDKSQMLTTYWASHFEEKAFNTTPVYWIQFLIFPITSYLPFA